MSDDDYNDGPECETCGDDGIIMLSEAGPGEWGEDCFCEEDRLIACPDCSALRARKKTVSTKVSTPNQALGKLNS